MKSVGIDIGSNQVKVVEIQTTSKGFQLTHFHVKQLSRATGTDLDLEVIEFLREVAARYDAASTRFCVGLRQDRVAVRNKFFNFADRLKIQKTLPFDLEEDVPFSVDNAVFEGKIVRIVGSGAEVLACAAPKQHVSQLLQLMKDSSIEPQLVSSEGLAFANLFERWNEPIPAQAAPAPQLEELGEKPERPIRVVLNIGHSRTLVCAFEGASLVGVRTILWGGRNIAEAIATKYNLPPTEALKEMEMKAFILTSRQEASYEAKIFSDLIAKCVRELVRDLQLTMLEFKSEFGGLIQQIQITGGVANIQGLGPYLTQHLEIPVNRIGVLDLIPNVQFDRDTYTNSRLGVAIGLAMEGLRKPRNPALNFMKNEFARQTSFAKDLWKEWGKFVQLGLIACLLLTAWAFSRVTVMEHLDEASRTVLRNQAKAIAKLPAKSANENNVKKYIRENRKKVTEIRTLESLAGMNSAMEILQKISGSVPSKEQLKLDVTSISVKDDRVHMTGHVNGDTTSVETLRKSLTGLAADGQVQSAAPSLSGGKASFNISFRVDRNIQKVTK